MWLKATNRFCHLDKYDQWITGNGARIISTIFVFVNSANWNFLRYFSQRRNALSLPQEVPEVLKKISARPENYLTQWYNIRIKTEYVCRRKLRLRSEIRHMTQRFNHSSTVKPSYTSILNCIIELASWKMYSFCPSGDKNEHIFCTLALDRLKRKIRVECWHHYHCCSNYRSTCKHYSH